MATEPTFNRQAFLHLAQEAGLDVQSPHMDELFSYTQVVLGTGHGLLTAPGLAG